MKRKSVIAIILALACIPIAGCGNSAEISTPSENSVNEVTEIISENSIILESSSKPESSNGSSRIESSQNSILILESSAQNSVSNGSSEIESLQSKPVQDSVSENSKQNSNSNSQTSKEPEISKAESSQSKPVQNSNPKQESSRSESSAAQPVIILADSVSLSRHELSLTVGGSAKLTATISPSNTQSKKVIWYWSDDAVISIDKNGIVTAKKAGTATITVKTDNGKTDTCKVTVKAKPVQQSSTPSSQTSKPAQQSSKPSSQSSAPESSTYIDPRYAAYYAPYDWDAIIADLRKVGEEQYGMIWEESLWVKNRGQDYGSKFDEEWGYHITNGHYQGNAQFGFPEANTDSYDGKDFREGCLYLFESLKKRLAKYNDTLENTYFKIVVEHIGINMNGDDEYWVYLLYT